MSWGERAGVRRNWTQAARKKLRAEWREELSGLLEGRFTFLSLPDTLELRYRFLERVREGGDRQEAWDRADREALDALLGQVGLKLT